MCVVRQALVTFVGTTYTDSAADPAKAAASSPPPAVGTSDPTKTPTTLHSFKTDAGDDLMRACGWTVDSRLKMSDVARSFDRHTIPDTFGYYFVAASV